MVMESLPHNSSPYLSALALLVSPYIFLQAAIMPALFSCITFSKQALKSPEVYQSLPVPKQLHADRANFASSESCAQRKSGERKFRNKKYFFIRAGGSAAKSLFTAKPF